MKKKHKHWKWEIAFIWEHKMKKNNASFMLYFFTHSYYRLLDKVLKHFYSNSGKVLLCLPTIISLGYLPEPEFVGQ